MLFSSSIHTKTFVSVKVVDFCIKDYKICKRDVCISLKLCHFTQMSSYQATMQTIFFVPSSLVYYIVECHVEILKLLSCAKSDSFSLFSIHCRYLLAQLKEFNFLSLSLAFFHIIKKLSAPLFFQFERPSQFYL